MKGFDQAISITLDEIEIRVLPLPYFLATKFDAFYDRGIQDVYASKDLEDLVYLFIHTSNIVDQIVSATDDVRLYLGECVHRLMNDPTALGAIPGHLFYENAEEQYQVIKQTFIQLTNKL